MNDFVESEKILLPLKIARLKSGEENLAPIFESSTESFTVVSLQGFEKCETESQFSTEIGDWVLAVTL